MFWYFCSLVVVSERFIWNAWPTLHSNLTLLTVQSTVDTCFMEWWDSLLWPKNCCHWLRQRNLKTISQDMTFLYCDNWAFIFILNSNQFMACGIMQYTYPFLKFWFWLYYCYPNRSENSRFKRKINKINRQTKCEESIAVAASFHLLYASLQ